MLVLVVPCVLCASAVKLVRSSFHKPQPVLCDGVEDDADAFVLCGLPVEVTKKPLLTKARLSSRGVNSSSAIVRPRSLRVRRQLISFPRVPRLLIRRMIASADPDGAH